MRFERLTILVLLVVFVSCASDQDEFAVDGTSQREEAISAFDPLAGVQHDLLDFNILQQTCALYVALRSSAWEGPIPFGRELDDSMVHWNMCPGGTMVACSETPAANGDPVITGIPWPYAAETDRR